jgi:hypothetical protein
MKTQTFAFVLLLMVVASYAATWEFQDGGTLSCCFIILFLKVEACIMHASKKQKLNQ